MRIEFALFGGMAATVDGAAVELGPARQRAVLAALLVDHGRAVSSDQLAYRVWGEEPPRGAAGNLRVYVSRLRRALADTPVEIVHTPAGYVAKLGTASVDVEVFRELVAKARASENDVAAADLLDRAFRRCRGEPFAGLEGPWFDDRRAAVELEVFTARLDQHDVALRLGGHAELLTRLPGLVAQHPQDERLAGQYLLALHRSGRQAEALAHYDRLRRDLADQLGIDPSPALRLRHEQILTDQPDSPSADGLEDLAAQLAETVASQWLDEERVRGVHDPIPLPVSWTNAPDHLADHWASVHRSPHRHDEIDLSGQLGDVVDVFARVPSRRLVVLGAPGAGKTILTTRFVLSYLEGRTRDQPVPVIFSLGSWHPGRLGLRTWMTGQLVTSYPALTTASARRLLAAGRILPVLDGFDEIGADLRGAAVQEINRALGHADGLVLTSRPDEYAAVPDVITGAAVVALQDLDIDDVESYLRMATHQRTTGAPSRWDAVVDRLRAGESPVVLAVLRVPLMLSMARAIYSESAADPGALLRFTDRQQLETHLLSSFVPTVYRSPDDEWGEERALRWLRFLARTLCRRRTYDLAWWQLHHGLAWPPRLVAGVLGAVACGLIAFVAARVSFALSPLLTGLFTATAATVALVTASAKQNAVPHTRRPRLRWRNVLPALVSGVLPAFACWLLFWLIAIGLAIANAGPDSIPSAEIVADYVEVATSEGLFVWVLAHLIVSTAVMLRGGAADTARAADPVSTLRSDRRITVLMASAFGAIVFAMIGLATGWLSGMTTPMDVVSAFVLATGAASVAGTFTAWGTSLVIRAYLALTRRTPWRLMAFLQDAHRRGVLRQTGAVYQFRHARVQDHLAASRPPSRG